MKKLIIFIAIIASSIAMNAQEAAEIKNAGNEALRNKDYQTALGKFEAYLASGEEGAANDKAVVYNAATCANKLKDAEKAMKYYQQAIDLNYKADNSTYYIAVLYKKAGEQEKYLAKLAEGLEKYPRSKIKKYYLAGLTKHYNKEASEPYNAANKLFTEAGVSGDYATYVSKAKKALPLFEQAKEGFNKTLEYDPTNATAKSAIANISASIQSYKDYVKSVKENQ